LRTHARNHNRRLSDVGRALITGQLDPAALTELTSEEPATSPPPQR